MHFFIIDGNKKTIEQQESVLDEGKIKTLIGYASIESDELNDETDFLYFDESCFIRQTSNTGRFQYKNLAPVSGIGVVTGKAGNDFTAPTVTLENLKANVRFL
jgi:hypothetical protein